jgi:hypothetical protein
MRLSSRDDYDPLPRTRIHHEDIELPGTICPDKNILPRMARAGNKLLCWTDRGTIRTDLELWLADSGDFIQG